MKRTGLVVPLVVTVGVVLPLLAPAQPRTKVARIGILWGGDTPFAMPYIDAGRRALGELGYVEGRDVVAEIRLGERKPGAVDALATDLVDRKVDVIIAAGDTAIFAARRATNTIPIVMIAAGDPVKAGLAASFARPGGNVTGMTFLTRELAGKRLEMLKEAVPSMSRVAVLWNPDNPGGSSDLQATRAAAENLKVTVQSFEARQVAELEPAFKAMAAARVNAVIALTDPLTATLAGRLIAELALKTRLPLVCDLSEFTRAGALLSYGPSLLAMAGRSAVFVDKLLKGAKAAELPIEQPTRFELTINLKTADALGVTIPSTLAVQADELIR
jgi:putative ABC transport system substrate-binding protein